MSFHRSSPEHPGITAAILAGGRARRMGGVRKGLTAVGGTAILDRQIAVLSPRFAGILLVAASPQDRSAAPWPLEDLATRPVRLIHDRFAASGPMGGLHAALSACDTEWAFVFACDMPFLDGAILDRMAALARDEAAAEALVPWREGRPEPLHALYRASMAARAGRCLEEGRRAMVDLLADLRCRRLTDGDLPGFAQGRSWMNMNSLEDLAEAEAAIDPPPARRSGG